MTYTYPGVYVEEVSSGVRTITSVSTSITAFVDFFTEGPMNVPQRTFGMSEFYRIFGGPDARSEASYAISQFFQNGGGQAIVVRSATGAVSASVGIRGPSTAGTRVLTLEAANEGAWGNNLRVEIDAATSDPTRLFNLTVTRYDSDAANARQVGWERFTSLSLDNTHRRYVVDVLEDESILIRATAAGPAGTVPTPSGTTSGSLAAVSLNAVGSVARNVNFSLNGRFYRATMVAWTAGEVTQLSQLATRLQAAIRTALDTATPPLPLTPGITGATVTAVGDRLCIRAGHGDDTLDSFDTIVFNGADAILLALTAATADNVQSYVLGSVHVNAAAYERGTRGGDGLPPNADTLVGPQANFRKTGLFALEGVDLFNILCLPRAVEGGPAPALLDADVTLIVTEALILCERKRAFFLLDIPERINRPAEITEWVDVHAGLRHRNAAVFFPRVRIPDPLNEQRLRDTQNSGTMAGIFARTDSERGVFKAPAGVEAVIRGVPELARRLTDQENGTLNPLGINSLRTFPTYGTVSWGARTLDGADQLTSEWKYIPIRRLALMIEESLFRGTKWVVFEPNDEPLWGRIRLNVGAYMMSLFRQGAFQGKTPRDAFYVKCDGQTTTANDRNQGIVNIEVGFAPLKPAEFIVIKIQQIADKDL